MRVRKRVKELEEALDNEADSRREAARNDAIYTAGLEKRLDELRVDVQNLVPIDAKKAGVIRLEIDAAYDQLKALKAAHEQTVKEFNDKLKTFHDVVNEAVTRINAMAGQKQRLDDIGKECSRNAASNALLTQRIDAVCVELHRKASLSDVAKRMDALELDGLRPSTPAAEDMEGLEKEMQILKQLINDKDEGAAKRIEWFRQQLTSFESLLRLQDNRLYVFDKEVKAVKAVPLAVSSIQREQLKLAERLDAERNDAAKALNEHRKLFDALATHVASSNAETTRLIAIHAKAITSIAADVEKLMRGALGMPAEPIKKPARKPAKKK